MEEATSCRHRRSDHARPRHGSRDTSPPENQRRLPPPPPLPAAFSATAIRPATAALKRVQVVYYLSRNGHLEHPHFMEVTHLHTRQLVLKDVMDRLAVLRGKAMPSLYSWSCKRSYKNGYVWNDLAENDVVYPCDEGAEYILKGSELFHSSSSSSEKLQVNDSQMGFDLVVRSAQPVRHGDVAAKRRSVASKRHPGPEDDARNNYGDDGGEVCAEENGMGVRDKDLTPTELTRDDSSPPSTASSLSEKGNDGSNNSSSMRYEDGDPVGAESVLSRNSVLFQLISCGGSASFRAKSLASLSRQSPAAASAAAVGRKSCSGSVLQKGVLVRAAAATSSSMDDEEEIIIKYMSENPRFGNMQSEEKEYFSGSIVESIASEEKSQIGPSLKKSNSYNEERKCKGAGLGEEEEEEEGAEKEVKKRGKSEKATAGKCIPMKKSSSKQSSKK